MDLRRRLAQLPAPKPPAPPPGELGEAAPTPPSERDSGHPPERASEAAARSATLDELRARMTEILGRPIEPPRPPADPSRTLLPFVARESEHGVTHHRLERMPRSYRVGRMSVDAAIGASQQMLALLALDASLAGVSLRRALYVDTETTGLGSGAGVLAFLVGLAWFDDDGQLVMEQVLLRRPGEEQGMLALLRERFERADVIVSYNGKAFDLPLLATRYVMNRLPPLPARPHLDLLHVARRLHKKRLGACRLVSLEADVLGFVRGPDIEGFEVCARYAHFLRSGDEEALRAVVDHNALDVVSMVALVALYGEPLTTLHDEDLIGLARVFARAKALDQARVAAERAVARAFDPEARRVRGEIAKARGDRAQALSDFEAFAREVDDPSARLELAKLYEHHVKDPLEALAVLERGTGETPEALEKRRQRLQRKAARRR